MGLSSNSFGRKVSNLLESIENLHAPNALKWLIIMAKFGGPQPGSGRPKGIRVRKTQEIIEKATAGGITPLEYMMNILRDDSADPATRNSMAIAAAPYIHPKLSSVEAKIDMKGHEKALQELNN